MLAEHLEGIAGLAGRPAIAVALSIPPPELLRHLTEYEHLLGRGW